MFTEAHAVFSVHIDLFVENIYFRLRFRRKNLKGG